VTNRVTTTGRPDTVRGVLGRVLRARLAVLALFAAGWFAGLELGPAVLGGPHDATPGDSFPPVTSSPAPGSPADLIRRHDCWTGPAPHDVTVPGHVVITQNGVTRYAGPRMTGLALEQVFGDADHGLTVHAFCR